MTEVHTTKHNFMTDIEKSMNRCLSSHHARKKTPLSPLLLISTPKKNLIHRQISPFEKITSKAFICQSTLPSFLREQPSRRLRTFKTQVPVRQVSPIRFVNKEAILEEITSFLKDRQDNKDLLLRVCGIELNYEDLASLRPHQEVTRNVVDAYLKLIKKRNKRKINEKKEPLERVFPLRSKVVKQFFEMPEGFRGKTAKDLLKYE